MFKNTVLQKGMIAGRVLQEERVNSKKCKKNTQLRVLKVIFINHLHIACHDVVI